MSDTSDIQSLIWLINAELSTVTNSLRGATPNFGIETIRVKMGQNRGSDENETTRLSEVRYPLAKDGWQIDLEYKVDLSKAAIVPERWQGLSGQIEARYIRGIGSKLASKLTELNIVNISELEGLTTNLAKQHGLRLLQTLASYALAVPPVAIPSSLAKQSVIKLLDTPDLVASEIASKSEQGAFLNWLRDIEVCIDKALLERESLKRLIEWKLD